MPDYFIYHEFRFQNRTLLTSYVFPAIYLSGSQAAVRLVNIK